jgi:hypothetical protein
VHHRIVSTVVVIIVAMFVAASALFTWAATAVSPTTGWAAQAPDNPHPPARRTDACLDCHVIEEDSLPVTHRHYTLQSCSTCHPPAVRVLVPHSITMGDARCPLCHGEPGRDLGIPPSHLRFETDRCLLCHQVDTRFYDRQPAPAGLSLAFAADIPHPISGIFEDCDYCHHVDARSSLPENHREFGVETCRDCHLLGEQE